MQELLARYQYNSSLPEFAQLQMPSLNTSDNFDKLCLQEDTHLLRKFLKDTGKTVRKEIEKLDQKQ